MYRCKDNEKYIYGLFSNRGQTIRQDKQPTDDNDDKPPTQVSLCAQCIRYIQYNLFLFYYFCSIYGEPTISGGAVW